MPVTTWTNGLFSGTGPGYSDYSPTWVSGSVIWVHSSTGNDSNAGTLEEKPKATLASAISAAASNEADTILIKSGHTQTVTASQAFTNKAGLTIIGLGTGSNRPRFTVNGAVDYLAVSVTDVWIENLFFVASTAAATSRIKVTADGCTIKDCYFQCGASDTTDTVLVGAGADNCRIEGCTFISTGTTSAQPGQALRYSSGVLGAVVRDCTFDGSSGGWSGGALNVDDVALQYFRFLNNTLTGYSDILFDGTSSKGTIAGVTQSGVGSVQWWYTPSG